MATAKREQILQEAEKLVARGKLDAAIREYRRALENAPHDTNTLNRLGDVLVRVNHIPEAIDVYQRIAEHFSEDGFFLKAIAIYKKINRLDPQRTETYERLADLYFKQGLVVEGRQQLLTLADWFLRSKQAPEAIRIYRRLGELEPSNFQARAKLVDLLVQVGDVAGLSVEIDPLGRALLARGMLDEAIKLYHRALDLRPESGDFAAPCIEALTTAGRHGQAVELAGKALEPSRRGIELLRVAAHAYAEAGDLKMARSLLDKLMPRAGERTDVIQLYGDVMLRVGEAIEAKEHVLPAVDRLLAVGDVERAGALVKRLLKSTPGDIDVLERALRIFNRRADPDMVQTIEAALADAYFRAGRKEAAGKLYRELAQGEPDNQLFAQRLEALGAAPVKLAAVGPRPTPMPSAALEVAAARAPEQELEFVDFEVPTEAPPVEEEAAAVLHAPAPAGVAPGAAGAMVGRDVAAPARALGSPAPLEVEEILAPLPKPVTSFPPLSEPPASFAASLELPRAFAAPPPPSFSSFAPAEPEAISGLAPEPAPPRSGFGEGGMPGDLPVQATSAEELFTEAVVFAKYGLSDKAITHLHRLLALDPVHSRGRELLASLGGGEMVEVEFPAATPPPAEVVPEPETALAAGVEVARPATSGGRGRVRLEELEAILGIGGPSPPPPRRTEERPLQIAALDFSSLLTPRAPAAAPVERPPAEPPPPLAAPASVTVLERAEEVPLTPAEEEVEALEEPVELVEVADFLAGPSEEQLHEVDFFIEQGLLQEAAAHLQKLRDTVGDHPDLSSRQTLLKARGWEEARVAAAPEASAEELFSEEERFFDLAAELERELADEEMVAEATGSNAAGEVSIEELFREFQRGVAEQLHPEDYDTHFNLGIAYREMGLLDEAIREFQLAAQSPALAVEATSMIGASYIDQGLPEQAMQWFERALANPSISPDVELGLRYELGRAHEISGNTDAAIANFAEVLAINPGFRDVIDRVARLRTN